MDFETNKSKVYALVDMQNRITRIDGGYTIENIADISEWTYLDEGYGDRYNLCQSNYLDGALMTMDGIYRYKLVDGQAVERTEAEIQADRDAMPPPPPSEQERISALETNKADKTELDALNILLGVSDDE